MKKLWSVLLLLFPMLFPSDAICQASEDLKLPKPDEIDRVEISNTSMVNWYKPEELLGLLPELAPAEGTYTTKGAFQRGTFVLKDGKKIAWMAGNKGSILLYAGGAEQLYTLSGKKNNAGLDRAGLSRLGRRGQEWFYRHKR